MPILAFRDTIRSFDKRIGLAHCCSRDDGPRRNTARQQCISDCLSAATRQAQVGATIPDAVCMPANHDPSGTF